MTTDPAHEAIGVRLETIEGEVESLRHIKHDHANAIVVLQERVASLSDSIKRLEKMDDDFARIAIAIPQLSGAVEKLRTTLLGVDDDGGVKSRVAAVETALRDQAGRLKLIQWGVIALVGLLGPEQLKLLVGTITGLLR